MTQKDTEQLLTNAARLMMQSRHLLSGVPSDVSTDMKAHAMQAHAQAIQAYAQAAQAQALRQIATAISKLSDNGINTFEQNPVDISEERRSKLIGV